MSKLADNRLKLSTALFSSFVSYGGCLFQIQAYKCNNQYHLIWQKTHLLVSNLLEFISKVHEEIWFLGAVAVTDGTTYGAKYRIEVVGGLTAKESLVVEKFSNTA